MDLEEIKSRINPQYQDVIGTESYERKWLCDEIERLRKGRDELVADAKRYRLLKSKARPVDVACWNMDDHGWQISIVGDHAKFDDAVDAALAKLGADKTATYKEIKAQFLTRAHGGID